jgi:hypothetical protein
MHLVRRTHPVGGDGRGLYQELVLAVGDHGGRQVLARLHEDLHLHRVVRLDHVLHWRTESSDRWPWRGRLNGKGPLVQVVRLSVLLGPRSMGRDRLLIDPLLITFDQERTPEQQG